MKTLFAILLFDLLIFVGVFAGCATDRHSADNNSGFKVWCHEQSAIGIFHARCSRYYRAVNE